jgi:alpha-D-xyloside xylohydrolase
MRRTLVSLTLVVAAVWAVNCMAGEEGDSSHRSEGRDESRATWASPAIEPVCSGVWRVRYGTPERFTPVAVREADPCKQAIDKLPAPNPLPFQLGQIRCRITSSRTTVYIPCDEPGEQIYGFGLDPGAYEQKGLRKYLGVCAEAVGKTGASHGPVPFYISTKGYGVFVDTARVALVHVARLSRAEAATTKAADRSEPKTSERELYAARKMRGAAEVVFELQGNQQGVDVYVFGGPTLREVVQRYNLFSGGGAVPPLWGLGLKYRSFTRADQAAVLNAARSLRGMNIPCDMIGLEPGWQSKAYSCSLAWSPQRFPQPDNMLEELRQSGFKVNLWEHAYVNPQSPLFGPLKSRAGDFLVWGGLVVDFADPEAFRIFADYHDKQLVSRGVQGFKLDECDNQPISDATPFNYPSCSIFPSGIDGDQMTQLYGYFHQRSVFSVFKSHNQRTWGDVRATTALAAPLPFNLYSDAYGFDQYLRQLVNASFTGLLWSPEVREAHSLNELLNRIAMSAFAPQMCLDLWFMPHPLWEQYDAQKNKANQALPEAEQKIVAERVRTIVNQRYQLLPYLYSCFHRYCSEGLPPVRSLLLEFPLDAGLRGVDDAFMFGDSLLAAPFVGEASTRQLTLPQGLRWYELKTGLWHKGGSKIKITGTTGEMPLFVKENSLLPLAEPVQCVNANTVFKITVKVFGSKPASFALIEDDGETCDYQTGAMNRVLLTWDPAKGGQVERTGAFSRNRYVIVAWDAMGSPEDELPGK